MDEVLFQRIFGILKNVGDIVYLKDLNGIYRAANPKFSEILNLPIEEIIGKTTQEILGKDLADRIRISDQDVIENGEKVFEITIGDNIYSLQKSLFHDENGKIAGIIAIGRDITDIKKSQEKSRKSETIFRLVLNTVPEAIFWKDTESRYIGGNRLFCEETGLKQSDLPGKTDKDLPWKKLADGYVADDKLVMDTNTPKIGYIEPYCDVKTGERKYAKTSKVPILLNDTVIGVMGTYRDVTQELQDREDLEKAVVELELSNRELQQFAYIAAHDLKAPLRQIHLKLDFLEEELDKIEQNTDDARQLMNDVHELSSKMTQMVNGLLEYSRITRKTEDYKVIDLNALIDDIIRIFPNNSLKIAVNDLPSIRGDESQIHRLFQNLLDNANKFRDSTKEDNIVCLYHYHDTNNESIICMEDNGVGFPSEHQEQAFEIFRSLHTKEEGAGDGLGLAICKKIVEGHKGRIWIQSKEGEGTKIFIAFRKFA